MPTNTLKIIIAIFFIAHAFIHISLSWAPIPKPGAMRTPFFPSWKRTDTDPKWPISKLGLPGSLVRITGSILFLAVTVAFCLAALGLLGVPGLNMRLDSTGWWCFHRLNSTDRTFLAPLAARRHSFGCSDPCRTLLPLSS